MSPADTVVYTAPHAVLQDAMFCLAYTGEGAGAQILHGWQALVATIERDVAGDGWPEALADLDEWGMDESNAPFCYQAQLEITTLIIYRVDAPACDHRTRCTKFAEQDGAEFLDATSHQVIARIAGPFIARARADLPGDHWYSLEAAQEARVRFLAAYPEYRFAQEAA